MSLVFGLYRVHVFLFFLVCVLLLLPLRACMGSSINSYVFAVYHGADSKYNTASTMSEIWINRPAGLSFFKTSWSSLACIGVSTAPGEIVLARIPSATNSMASARLNAGRVDLVMTGNEMGAPASGCSATIAEMLTIWPDFCFRICATTCCVTKKYPATLVPIIISKSSGVYSVNGLGI